MYAFNQFSRKARETEMHGWKTSDTLFSIWPSVFLVLDRLIEESRQCQNAGKIKPELKSSGVGGCSLLKPFGKGADESGT